MEGKKHTARNKRNYKKKERREGKRTKIGYKKLWINEDFWI